MWNCEKCNEGIDDTFDKCLKCFPFVTLVQYNNESEVEELELLLKQENIQYILTNIYTLKLHSNLQVHIEDKERTLSLIKTFNESKSLQRKLDSLSTKKIFLINILSFITFILACTIGSFFIVILGTELKSIVGVIVAFFVLGVTSYVRKLIKSYFRNNDNS
tara:strand:+ start:507 stop:992 length:486 start_codon:yes stop_codon:yes gene_type:complete